MNTLDRIARLSAALDRWRVSGDLWRIMRYRDALRLAYVRLSMAQPVPFDVQ